MLFKASLSQGPLTFKRQLALLFPIYYYILKKRKLQIECLFLSYLRIFIFPSIQLNIETRKYLIDCVE